MPVTLMNNVERSFSGDSRFLGFLVGFWFVSWNYFAIDGAVQIALYVFAVVASLGMIFANRHKVSVGSVFFILAINCLFLLSTVYFLIQGRDLEGFFWDGYIKFCLFGSLGFLLAQMVEDFFSLLKSLLLFSVYGILLSGVIVYSADEMVFLNSYMQLSYYLFYAFVFVPMFFLLKGRWLFFWIGFLVFGGVLIFLGTRGAVVSFFVLVCSVMFVFRYGDSGKYGLFALFALIAGVLVVLQVVFLNFYLLTDFSDLFSHSRLMALFSDDAIGNDSGRGNFYGAVYDGIKSNPFFGGIGADRFYLVERGVVENINSYAHNIYLELLAHFGIVLGFVAIFCSHYWIYKTLVASYRNKIVFVVLASCIGIWFFPRLFSSTYLVSQTLVVAGLCVAAFRTKRRVIL
jgi:hypothetical protein